jgi:phospholipid-binding lipoprotein MlaA
MNSRRWPLSTFYLALLLGGAACASAPAGADTPDSGAAVENLADAPGSPSSADEAPTNDPVLVEFTDDPIEPFNRVSYVVSDEAMDWVIIPLARGYSFIFREPVRESIGKFGANLAYPVRLINTLLQGKFRGARDETGRFVVNTTVGLLGFFDPAKKWGLEPYEEDFGQTFGVWGMGTGFYFFLPVTGPSSGRDTLGAVGDALANPATYVPGLSPFLTFNDLTFLIDDYERLTQSQSDPYFLLREIWSVDREKDVVDYTIPPDAYEGDSLLAITSLEFLEVRNPHFRRRAKTRKAPIAATGRELPYSIWPRKDSTGLVFILPGVGSHRNSGLSHAVAEMIDVAGFTPVTVSSPFNWEFIDNAATAAVPGYTPFDVADTERALAAIYEDVNRRTKGQYEQVAVVGLSLGALHALFMAEQASADEAMSLADTAPRPPYSRFIAISPPVDPLHSLHTLDGFYEAPLAWPEDQRAERIEETLFKGAIIAREGLGENGKLPFDATESRFLIGLGYRNILHNAILASQRRVDRGVLKTPWRWSRRGELYHEIWNYGYTDYMERFVIPYVQETEGAGWSREAFLVSAGLRSIEAELAADSRVQVIATEDDFVMKPEDSEWLDRTMGPRLIRFRQGGHLSGIQRQAAIKALERLFEGVPTNNEPR